MRENQIKLKGLVSFVLCFLSFALFAQQPLPAKIFNTMRDSTNAIDVVFYDEDGGSISGEGKDTQFFNYFFEGGTAKKLNVKPGGSVMWQINGREYLSGTFYLADSTGYLVTTKDGQEYVNKINKTGYNFLNGGYKRH